MEPTFVYFYDGDGKRHIAIIVSDGEASGELDLVVFGLHEAAVTRRQNVPGPAASPHHWGNG